MIQITSGLTSVKEHILQMYLTFEVMVLDCNLFCEISFSLGYLIMYMAYLYTLGH